MSPPQSTELDPLAPFPTIVTTARSIISHILAQPRHKKAHEILSIPLLEHLLDLFCHVNLVDQRMDELEDEREDEVDWTRIGQQRKTRNKFFSWTMLIKAMYCSSALSHLTTSASARTDSSQIDSLQALEHDIDHLFLVPPSPVRNGNHPDMERPQEERLYRRWLNETEKEASKNYREKFKVAMRDWKSSGKYEPFRLPSLGRTAECVLNYINAVEARYQAFDLSLILANNDDPNIPHGGMISVPAPKTASEVINGLGRGIAPPLTPSSTAASPKGRTSDRDQTGRREPSASFIPDARSSEQVPISAPASTNGKGKGREVGLVDYDQGIKPPPASTRISDRDDGDAARLRLLRTSLNGGKEKEDRVSGRSGATRMRQQVAEGSNGEPGRHAHFDQTQEEQVEREEESGELAEDERQVVVRRPSATIRKQPPVRYLSETRQTDQSRHSSRGPVEATPLQRRAPRASLPSRLAPVSSPSVSRSRAGSVRESSGSTLHLPGLPPGTIVRVEEGGKVRVLVPSEEQDQEDRGRPYQGHPSQSLVGSGREQTPRLLQPEEEEDEGFLDQHSDENQADAEYSQEESERAGSEVAAQPFTPPAGHHWVLVPDDEPYEGSVMERSPVYPQSAQQSRRHERRSTLETNQVERQRMLPRQRKYRLVSDAQQRQRTVSVANRRSSVQPAARRYVTPVPVSQSRIEPNNNPRRRHTEHARPQQPSPAARSSVELNRQALPVTRRRQAYSLGGASENRHDYGSTSNDALDVSNGYNDRSDNDLDSARITYSRQAQVASRSVTKNSAQEPVARNRPFSRPNQSNESGRSISARPTAMSTAGPSSRNANQGSSPSLKRHRPFSDHQVLRNPQSAKRARTSGLSTGRPEFQLAGATEDRRSIDDSVTRVQRQKEITSLENQRKAAEREYQNLFILSSSDDNE